MDCTDRYEAWWGEGDPDDPAWETNFDAWEVFDDDDPPPEPEPGDFDLE